MKKYFCLLVCLLLCATLCLASCDKGNAEKVGRPSGGKGGSVPTMGNTDDDEGQKKYEKTVALTLDDGPHNVRTKAIVDELDKYDFNATFFVVGNRVDGTDYDGSSALKYAYEHGNEIGIHGYTHRTDRYYDTCSDDIYKYELSETEKAIKAVIPKYSVKLMRPVGGKITDKRVQSCKYSVIMWSVDSEDWKYQYSTGGTDEANEKRDAIVENVMSQVKDGSIILMHDIYQSTYDAAVIILERLNEQGYGVVTVSELLGKNMSAGKKYSKAISTPEQVCIDKAEKLIYCTNINKKTNAFC